MENVTRAGLLRDLKRSEQMELRAFRVSGLRCLAGVDWVPLAKPTILTGANDGGKSSLLLALNFLLVGKPIAQDDFTSAVSDATALDGTSTRDSRECSVEGRARLSDEESKSFELPLDVSIRRRQQEGGASPSLEIVMSAPADERLRGLDKLGLDDLKQTLAELGAMPVGPANRKESYLVPLLALAANQGHEDVWMPMPPKLEDNLPRFISFASTAEPDPEIEIRQVLQEAYARSLEDASIVGPVREAEAKVRDLLKAQAEDLREHIVGRCPELKALIVDPSVSFKEGFGGVHLSLSRPDGPSVGLAASGAGTRRRISLAAWEWARLLLRRGEPDGRSVIVAYDEPDTHLDYSHQRDLVDLVRHQCEIPGVRVIMATHSLNLIDKIAVEDVVHVQLESERTIVRRLFSSEHGEVNRYLLNIATSMGLRNSVLLHERCFVGVEGMTEQQALPLLFRTATGLSLQAAGIAFVPAGGNSGALAFCKYLAQQGREVRFIVDRDSTRQRTFSPEKLLAAGVEPSRMYLLGNPNEIEDLFEDAQWAVVANDQWPRSNGLAWTSSDVGSLRQAGKFSSRLHDAIAVGSSDPPTGKSALLPALAGSLVARDEVPQDLLTVFDQLLKVTSAR
jgi:putative ATP-dependent endonuclease of OLD family